MNDQVRQSEAIKDLRVLRGKKVIREMGDGDEITINPNELEKQVMASGKTLFQEAQDPKHGHVLIAIFPAIASKNYLGRDCMECHEEVKDGNILGAVSLEDIDEGVAESRMGMLMATLMISVPLLLFVFIFVRSFVTTPLVAMAQNLREIASDEVLEPAAPVVRYEHPEPGDMLHLDIKKLSRFVRPGHRVTGDRTQNSSGAGWEFVHVALDDHSRFACADIQPDESGRSACRALLSALRYYRQFGITFRRVLTDNGSCYKSRQFARLCQRLGLRHLQTKPYSPQTNGKAECFIQTALREWDYARAYESSSHRAQHLPHWLHH